MVLQRHARTALRRDPSRFWAPELLPDPSAGPALATADDFRNLPWNPYAQSAAEFRVEPLRAVLSVRVCKVVLYQGGLCTEGVRAF